MQPDIILPLLSLLSGIIGVICIGMAIVTLKEGYITLAAIMAIICAILALLAFIG